MVTGSIVGSGCTSLIKPIERLGFKGLCMLDGPTAVNRADLVSVFPAALTVAATWDKDHFENRGKAIAEEFRGKGAHIALG
jgi:beta-glucosidase